MFSQASININYIINQTLWEENLLYPNQLNRLKRAVEKLHCRKSQTKDLVYRSFSHVGPKVIKAGFH